MVKVILDAGHGGNDTGDFYGSRFEKDDNLRLTLAVGQILQSNGIEVAYTRTNDFYLPQLERVAMINNLGGDLLVSIHRLFGRSYGTGPGMEFSVTEREGLGYDVAVNIRDNLAEIGFQNYGINIRTDLPVLSAVNMPSVMVGIGFMKSLEDHKYFDDNFDAIANAVANGIIQTLEEKEQDNTVTSLTTNLIVNTIPGISKLLRNANLEDGHIIYRYHVQIGVFRQCNKALDYQLLLLEQGLVTDIIRQGDLYVILAGDFSDMNEAVLLELYLKKAGFHTMLVAMGIKNE
jgi:N-acetylmuramoyl-L-alanine amidase